MVTKLSRTCMAQPGRGLIHVAFCQRSILCISPKRMIKSSPHCLSATNAKQLTMSLNDHTLLYSCEILCVKIVADDQYDNSIKEKGCHISWGGTFDEFGGKRDVPQWTHEAGCSNIYYKPNIYLSKLVENLSDLTSSEWSCLK